MRPTNQKRLKIAAVIYPDPLNTYSNVLLFIKRMTVMRLGGFGFAAVSRSGIIWHGGSAARTGV